jgi:hypothetical protein
VRNGINSGIDGVLMQTNMKNGGQLVNEKPITQEQIIETYRKVIPFTDYPECKGCHYGSQKCFAAEKLHNRCKCVNCLVFTSCTEYCEDHLWDLRLGCALIRKDAKGPQRTIQLDSLTNKGYMMYYKYRGRKYQVNHRLKRYMSKEELRLHGYPV